MKEKFDLVVIGGGAAGLFAASVANTLGAKTLLIDKERLGGDCTWFGCVPSKAILHASIVANHVKSADKFGLKLQGGSQIDTNGVMDYVRDIVSEISTHHPPEVFEQRGIIVKFGKVSFIGPDTIELSGERISAKKFIICTGSHPVVPPIEGLKDVDYLTNENIFELNELPKSIIVLGGGPIGVELSQSLQRLGVKVLIVEMFDRLLFREDIEASQILQEKLIFEGTEIYTGKKAVRFERKENEVVATLEDNQGKRQEIKAQKVLVAVGRAPNLGGLDLEKAGVEYTNKGLKVNDYLQTTNLNIFACGDIVGPYMFSHAAAYQASLAVRNCLFKRIAWQKANYSNIVWATFTDPEVSNLGLNESEAKEKYKFIKVYKNENKASDRAITDSAKSGLIKIITDKKGFILGASIVGANAGEIIQGLLVAKSLKQPLAKLAAIMYIYPTLSELVKKTAAKSLVEKMDNPLIKFMLKVMRKG